MRFLFCCLASPGYINPAVGIAIELRERGHDVAFVTDISFSELLSRHQLERIPLGAIDGSSFKLDRWFDAPSVALQMKHITYALTRFQPDVLVGQQLTFGPLLIGQHRNLPVGVLGFLCYLWPTKESEPGTELSWMEKNQLWRYEDMMKAYNRAMALLGLRPSCAPCEESPLLGDAFLLRSIPQMQPAKVPEKVHLVGDCLWEEEEPDPELDAWLEEARAVNAPIVYVHHGREFKGPTFWPAVAALADFNIRVAASIGRMDKKPENSPPTFFVRNYVPQSKVLRHASAMFATANTTAALGALTAGVPCLFPAHTCGEEPEVAEVCRAAGVAKLLQEPISGADLVEGLRLAVQDQQMQQAAHRVAADFARFDGRHRAADLLEQLVEVKRPLFHSNVTRAARVTHCE